MNNEETRQPDSDSSRRLFEGAYADIDIVMVPLRFSIPSGRIRRRVSDIVAGSRAVADLGCGHGGTTMILADMNKEASVTGIDFSVVALSKGRRLSNRPNLTFQEMDLARSSLSPGSYDFIYCSQVIEHFSEDDRFLNSISTGLLPGGYAFIGTVFKKRWARYIYRNSSGESVLHPDHVNEYTDKEDLFRKVRGNGMEVVDSETSCITYPLIDLFLKLLTRKFKTEFIWRLANSKLTMIARSATSVPIPGFFLFQTIVRKKP